MRARLWWRTRRSGALLLAPFRVTGRGAPVALDCLQIGAGTRIGQFAWFSLVSPQARVVVGADCMLSAGFSATVRERVEIGDGTAIGERFLVSDHGHDHLTYLEPALQRGVAPRFGYATTQAAPVRIGRGVHIGVGVVVSPGVRIGDGAVVGANAVVTHDVEPYTVVAGVPAVLVRRLVPEDLPEDVP